MNNDVAGKLNSCIGAQQKSSACANTIQKQAAQKTSTPIETDKMNDSMKYLNALGVAQVNMGNLDDSNSVKESVETFLNDPEYAIAHVELCDSIVEKGYCLREAIDKTDSVFQVLQNKDTYN